MVSLRIEPRKFPRKRLQHGIKRHSSSPHWMTFQELRKYWRDLKILDRDILAFVTNDSQLCSKKKLPPYKQSKRNKHYQKLSKMIIHKSVEGLRYTIKAENSATDHQSKEHQHDLTNPLALYHGLQHLDVLNPGLCPPLEFHTHALEEVRCRSRSNSMSLSTSASPIKE